MGAAASAQPSVWGQTHLGDPEAEWRSEITRDLDRLGGNQRPPIRRGQSTKYRLEWLKEAVHEQGDRLEEALAKDPLAGRHEIMRQEAAKLARTMNSKQNRLTVRQWQTMKHTDLRAQQAREDLERKLREHEQEEAGARPEWNSLYWSQNEHPRRITGTKTGGIASTLGHLRTSSSGQLNSEALPAATGKVTAAVVEPNSAVAAALSVAGTAVAVAVAARAVSPPWARSSGAGGASGRSESEDEPEVPRSVPRMVRPLTTKQAAEPLAEWRLRILRAKRKALMVIRVVLAFRGRKHRARGLQRLDSLSFLIAQHLGSDLERFTQEQSCFRTTRATASDLQALAEEVWRVHNEREQMQHKMMGSPNAYPAEPRDGNLTPSFPASPRGRIPSPGRRPQTRVPGGNSSSSGFSVGGTAPAASGGVSSGRTGSPLLRSRPTSLMPTTHHVPQSGNAVASALPVGPAASPQGASSSIGGSNLTGLSRNSLHGPPPAISGGGAAAALLAAPSSTSPSSPNSVLPTGSVTAAAHSGCLPVLPGRNSGRISVPSGLEDDISGGCSSLNGVVVNPIIRSERFSVPGMEPIQVPLLPINGNGNGSSVLPMDDGSSIGMADVMSPGLVTTPLSTLSPPLSGKRWQSPRFPPRGGTSGDSGESPGPNASRPPLGSVVNGSVGSRRMLTVEAIVAEDMALVSRSSSWAGPSAHNGHHHVVNGNGSSVDHSRSMGHEVPMSSSGGGGGQGSALPAPPALPSPSARNPRQRRESGMILTASASAATLPQTTPLPMSGMRTMAMTAPVEGYSALVAPMPGAEAGKSIRSVNRQGGGGLGRIASAAVGGNSGSGRRAGRVGARSVTGESDPTVALGGVSPYGERPQISPSSSRRALQCSSSIRRMVRDGSSDQLYLKYKEEVAALERPLRMMQLFANRANSRWVEELVGVPPSPTQSSSSNSLTVGSSAAPDTTGAVAGAGSGTSGMGSGWEPPHVYDGSRFSASVGAAQSSVFRAEVATVLRAGRVALQVMAGDEQLVLSGGQVRPLWNADPWDLIATEFPAKVAVADRVRHVHMGPRLLMALVSAVETLAGAEAVSRLVVLLHVNDCQQAEVVQQLRYRKFCGIRPENLILVVQQRRPGYYWDPEQTVFVADTAAPPASVGSGYAVMQLVWPEEALQVAPDEPNGGAVSAPSWAAAGGAAASAAAKAAKSAPELVPLGTSVLTFLSSRGVEWLMSRRLRDISLCNPELTLDTEVLSYSMYLHEHLGANMAVQVEMVDTVTAARAAQTGVVMAPPRPRRGKITASPGALVGSPPKSGRADVAQQPRRAGTFAAGSGFISAGGGAGGGSHPPLRFGSDVTAWSQSDDSGEVGGGLHFVVDVKSSDTSTPRTIQMLTELRSRGKGRLAVSTRRYMWRLDVLQSLVQRASIFHPCLEISGDLAYLTFDMADLTAATDFGARCVAVSGARPVRNLNAALDLEELYIAVLAQDGHAPFRRLAATICSAYGPSHAALPDRSAALLGLSAAITVTTSRPRPGTSPGIISGPLPPQVPSPALPDSTEGSGGAAASSEMRSLFSPGQVIVVLVADNESTTMAVQLLMALVKPGRDHVVLVTVVSSILQESAGRMLLRKHEMSLMRTLVKVASELLTKSPGGSLIEQLESFIEIVDPQLVVMGSQVLATASVPLSTLSPSAVSPGGGAMAGGGGGAAAALGSVAMSLLRASPRPMLIVKANAKFASIAWERDKLVVLLEVHHSSRNLLRYVCSKLVTPSRQDKVCLMRGAAKDLSQQETVTSRRLLENFSDIATQYKVHAVKRALEESFEIGAIKLADHDRAHLIALHAPAGRGISNAAFSILRASRSAVLVYKSSE